MYKRQALEGARDVLANDKATKEEVEASYTSLQQAIFNLRMKPSKEKLEELLNKVDKMDLTLYSAKSVKAIKEAYNAAVAVMKNDNAEQKDVDAAVKALENAITVAKAETKPETKPESGNSTQGQTTDKENTKKPAKTGDSATVAVPMMAGLAAILAVLFARKRR